MSDDQPERSEEQIKKARKAAADVVAAELVSAWGDGQERGQMERDIAQVIIAVYDTVGAGYQHQLLAAMSRIETQRTEIDTRDGMIEDLKKRLQCDACGKIRSRVMCISCHDEAVFEAELGEEL